MTDEFVMEYRKDHNDDDYVLLGELELFDTHDTIVQKVLGDINLKGKAKNVIVELYLREGWEKPHLHVYNKEVGFFAAIRLDINSYFIHGKYKDKLNDKQAKLFDEFMSNKAKNVSISRWRYAVDTFNMEFPDHSIKVKDKPKYIMLNYTT